MCQVNVLEAKTNFSKLLMLLETKQESEIIICKNNRPVAKITPMPGFDINKALGIAKGKLKYPIDIHDGDDEIIAMFEESINREGEF